MKYKLQIKNSVLAAALGLCALPAVSMANNHKVVAFMPLPANNAFAGETVGVSFDPNGISYVWDSAGNASFNQQVDGAVTFHIQVDGKTAQIIKILGPKASPDAAPVVGEVNSDVKVTAYMPPPANNSFSGDALTVSFNANGVSDIKDSKGNASLNQQKDGTVSLQVQVAGKTVKTINIAGPKGLRNLALWKKQAATQSSTAFNGPAALAVDGNLNSSYNPDPQKNQITHTADAQDNWWQVDLGKSSEIEKLVVWNRRDMNQDRLANFYVMVSEQPIQANSTTENVFSGPHSFKDAQQISLDIPGKKKGRYVRLFLKDSTQPLSLGEVQVFGRE